MLFVQFHVICPLPWSLLKGLVVVGVRAVRGGWRGVRGGCSPEPLAEPHKHVIHHLAWERLEMEEQRGVCESVLLPASLRGSGQRRTCVGSTMSESSAGCECASHCCSECINPVPVLKVLDY